MDHIRKKREIENPERQILEMAKILFARNGYKKTHMSEIAAAVGINRPTLHYYFRTKDILFESVFAQLMESFVPKIELITAGDLSVEEKIDRITDAYMSIYTDNPYLPQFILSEIQRDPEYLMTIMEILHFDKYLKVLEKMIITGKEKSEMNDIPTPIIFLSFFGHMVTPFLAKNILLKLFLKEESSFIFFLQQWKEYVKKQMKILLFDNEKYKR